MENIKIRSNFEPSEDIGINFKNSPSLTKQAEAHECNINNIMSRYEKTGVLPEMIQKQPQYGDFTEVPTYQDALNVVIKAQEQFDALSAQIRDRFSNDPEKMLAFASDPANGEEMIKLGMRVPAVEAAKKGEAVQTESTTPVTK